MLLQYMLLTLTEIRESRDLEEDIMRNSEAFRKYFNFGAATYTVVEQLYSLSPLSNNSIAVLVHDYDSLLKMKWTENTLRNMLETTSS